MLPPDLTGFVSSRVVPAVRELPPAQREELAVERRVVPAADAEAQSATSGRFRRPPAPPPLAVARRAASGPSTRASTPGSEGADASAGPSADETEQAVETLRRALRTYPTNLKISTDDSTGKTVIRVVNASSGEVVRQIPTEDALKLSAAAEELKGWLVRETA